MEKKESSKSKKSIQGTTRKGRSHKRNALEPELRLVDITTKEEIDADTLTVSRFESLTAADYHLDVLPPIRVPANVVHRGYLGAIGSGMSTIGSGLYSGVETVGQGMIDATMYPTRMLGANKLFSGSDSVQSGTSGGERTGTMRGTGYLSSWIPSFGGGAQSDELKDVQTTQGMKIFILSPYDCIIAVKRNLADRVQWLKKMGHYEEAWELLDQHPEAAGRGLDAAEVSPPATPSKASSLALSGSVTSPRHAQTKQQATLAEFFADSGSITSTARAKGHDAGSESEKRAIGELWLNQLTSTKKWSEAGDVAGKVLNTSARWEHWIWIFMKNQKFDEISPVVPTFQITPPLPSVIYEIILGHYVSADRARFKELLDLWPSDLFEIGTITQAIETQLKSNTAPPHSRDWQLLQECLAKLYLADGHYDEALRCYIQLQDAETAMTLIKEHHLVETVAADIPSFVLLRISSEQLRSGSRGELDELSSDPIKLLVDDATHGVVSIDLVVSQLLEKSLSLFLYFYLRGLWRGEGTKQPSRRERTGRYIANANLEVDEGKALVEQFADTAVELFAEFDRSLLMDFLHASTAYTFDKAVTVCERWHYVPELVYLLSKTGQLRKALFLIIDELKDVAGATAFAKEQDDKGLWDDLLEYSMSRPKFISGLLAEVGTAINPIDLIKRIPPGLEIDGLKDGLIKILREYDLQHSISNGVAKVLYGEVAVGMETLRQGRRRGIKFDVTAGAKKTRSRGHDTVTAPTTASKAEKETDQDDQPAPVSVEPGHCASCGKSFAETKPETLVGFACGHVYHLSHLLGEDGATGAREGDSGTPTPAAAAAATAGTTTAPAVTETQDADADESLEESLPFTRTIGPKVTRARLLQDQINAVGGCRICSASKARADQV